MSFFVGIFSILTPISFFMPQIWRGVPVILSNLLSDADDFSTKGSPDSLPNLFNWHE
jgi:hypothetical protein